MVELPQLARSEHDTAGEVEDSVLDLADSPKQLGDAGPHAVAEHAAPRQAVGGSGEAARSTPAPLVYRRRAFGEVSSCNEISYFLEAASKPLTREDAD